MDILGMDPLYFLGGIVLTACVIYGFVLANGKGKGGDSNNNNNSSNE